MSLGVVGIRIDDRHVVPEFRDFREDPQGQAMAVFYQATFEPVGHSEVLVV